MSSTGADEQMNERLTGTITFVPEFKINNDSELEPECKVNININDTGKYYYIEYTYEYQNSDSETIKKDREHPAHPFNKNKVCTNNTCFGIEHGVELVKNEMTTVMIKYLLMPDDELCKLTGHTTPMRYRNNIMLSLALLWD